MIQVFYAKLVLFQHLEYTAELVLIYLLKIPSFCVYVKTGPSVIKYLS